ncbi:hypothetical protein [Aggregatilinea lenta]|uniref:hypothetical protein n=1 Tax=Aggregatilinea lenta TaxID=913108 RepID=UPI000E5AD8B7|nr:hypothetical protein [Aggregatilinea lenta]
MHQALVEKWSMIEGTHGMRDEFMNTLTDADLAFNPGGQAMTLGALCREMGEIEHSYAQSFKTFTQDLNYRTPDASVETGVARLLDWYHTLDAEMETAVKALTDEDVTRSISRGFDVPVEFQLDVYIQALLIFFGKITVYLRVMNKPLTDKLQTWIG